MKQFLATIQSPNGPLSQLNLACAPFRMDVNSTLLALGVSTGIVLLQAVRRFLRSRLLVGCCLCYRLSNAVSSAIRS